MTSLRKLLGANIKIYRNVCGFSQAKLAECVGTATNYIAAIEAGRRFPSIEVLEKLAFALNIDAPELFSMKLIPLCTAKRELEEEIWQNIGKNIENYISRNLNDLKKKESIEIT